MAEPVTMLVGPWMTVNEFMVMFEEMRSAYASAEESEGAGIDLDSQDPNQEAEVSGLARLGDGSSEIVDP